MSSHSRHQAIRYGSCGGWGVAGHAESVKNTYDRSEISFGKLLEGFFSIAHDPTELNRQGPDTGTQYPSVIFYNSEEQQPVAEAYIQQLNAAKLVRSRILPRRRAGSRNNFPNC
jgi:peptide-methionine (S)-S-oxide reductase